MSSPAEAGFWKGAAAAFARLQEIANELRTNAAVERLDVDASRWHVFAATEAQTYRAAGETLGEAVDAVEGKLRAKGFLWKLPRLPRVGDEHVRDPEAPCEAFEKGKPKGDCETDGHYMCRECRFASLSAWEAEHAQ